MAGQDDPRRGTTALGADFLTWGRGPRTMLFLPGGPGSAVPDGLLSGTSRRWFDPFVDAGYAVWMVTRRRHMPEGHTIEDMADDYARVISDELGGHVDLVVGESFGGMIAQYLVALHGDLVGHAAIVIAAAEVSEWGKEVDARLAAALAKGDRTGVGMAFAEYALPGERSRWARRLIGPLIARGLLSGKSYPASDLAVEVAAELSFDARPVLPRITLPVLLVSGDRDRFFPKEVVEETARLIPDCTVVWHEGKGHMKVGASRRVPGEVLAHVGRR